VRTDILISWAIIRVLSPAFLLALSVARFDVLRDQQFSGHLVALLISLSSWGR
jgi:hypothetical protein